MPTIELTLFVPEKRQEVLVAELDASGCKGFWCEDDVLRAYYPAHRFTNDLRKKIEETVHAPIEVREIADVNWNVAWERTIQPRVVGPFLIKPSWAETPPEYAEKVVLTIDPKMSFGTGYHATTRLVLRLLPSLIAGGEHVLDVGTGTGILAIAAAKLGAASVLALDVDEWAQRNAKENFRDNGVASRVTFRAGTIGDVEREGFDRILANINRDVLLGCLPAFAGKLHVGGRLVLSGLLETDRSMMLGAASRYGFHVAQEAGEAGWYAVVLEKGA